MTNDSARMADGKAPSKAIHVGLWVVQALLSLTFTGTGLWKLLAPVSKLAAMIPWAGQVAEAFLQATAIVDLLGGIGVLIPSLTGVQPGLSAYAALGCAALQGGAIFFHLSRGEGANTPFNFVLVALAIFVF